MNPSANKSAGRAVIVLHAHLPYVEGFGTWPFGEDWLHNATASCYLPLLDLFERRPEAAGLTLSVTPVLADQLEAEGIENRLETWVENARLDLFDKDIAGMAATGHTNLAESLGTQRQLYVDALAVRSSSQETIANRLMAHASWTSSATHAVLPLCATELGAQLQINVGGSSHQRRAAAWNGGFWLPECAYNPSLDAALAAGGVQTTCVELTDVFGLGSDKHLSTYITPHGTRLLPLNRQLIDLVWGQEGYPAAGAYRDTHSLSLFELMPSKNAGEEWQPEAARAQAQADAAEWVSAAIEQTKDGGCAFVAWDAELFGLWWLEGIWWLEAVLDEASKQGLELIPADQLGHRDDLATLRLPTEAQTTTTWGHPRNLWTWNGPQVRDISTRTRQLELQAIANRNQLSTYDWQQLLALQSSDWAFQVSRGVAGEYGIQRFQGHAAELESASTRVRSDVQRLRNLAPWLQDSLKSLGLVSEQ